METAKDIADNIIKQAQQMRMFEIKVKVDDGWMPFGRVPFNIKIKGGIATVEVLARSEDDARHQVSTYMESDDWI